MRLFTLLSVVFLGFTSAHSSTATPVPNSPKSCEDYTNPQKFATCKVTENFDLASVNQDLKVIFGSSGTLSVTQPDAIIAPNLDTSVADLKPLEVAHNTKPRLSNVRPRLRPNNNTFYASRIFSVLDRKGRSDLSACLHMIEPQKQIELFPNKIDEITALNTLIEMPAAW